MPAAARPVPARDIAWAAAVLLIGAGLVAAGLGSNAQQSLLPQPQSPWWHLGPLAIACAAAAVATRHPLGALLVSSAMVLVDALLGTHVATLMAWTLSLYAIGRYGSAGQRGRALWLIGATAVLVTGWVLWRSGDAAVTTAAAVQFVLFIALPLWWSSEVRAGDEQVGAARARAEADRRLAELERVEAIREERGRVARDLHDTVSSHLSTIAIYTTGALDLPPSPDRDRGVLAEVRGAALAGLDDMRELIDVLRSHPAEEEADAAPERLESLFEELRSAGLEIRVEADAAARALLLGGPAEAADGGAVEAVDVGPADAADGWSAEAANGGLAEDGCAEDGLAEDGAAEDGAAVRRVAGRLLREALTNALKHGAGAAEIELRLDGSVLEIEVVNPIGDAGEAPAAGGGVGLGSMARRVREHGGSFRSGASASAPAEGGKALWCVRATLPLGAGDGGVGR
ncbi:sensor histidine kinase [Gulosibacter sp. 10]|uniref:sensor histidine kinase n=1 Tax=Gulosibacter sp. 10 TaxID=1255570 RepID=UPI00097EC569|nr:histidine kinase [Gulosibacter sp. 10]SJM63658.1 putative two-component system sensor kinase [Gulosibacter sp. 10]